MATKPGREKTEQERYPEKYFTSPLGHVKDRVVLHETAEITREGRTFALNGFTFLAKPGVEIDIPRPVRLMLDTRILTVTMHGEDGKEYTRDIQRVPYTLIKEGVNLPPPEAIVEPKREGQENKEEL